jgi:hypothetical protein
MMRKQRVLVVVLANVLLSIPFTIGSGSVAHAADCLAAPKGPPPAGSHWYYRLDRASKRKCWYLAPQGRQVRSGASQVASPEPLGAAAPKPPAAPLPQQRTATAPVLQQPTATIPQQPTVYEIIRELNAAPADAALGAVPPAGLLFPDPPPSRPERAAAANESDPPGATDPRNATERAPASTIGASANAADASEEMPPIWPVRAAAEAAVTAPAPTTTVAAASVSPATLLALLACTLAVAGFVGRAVVKVAAGRIDQRISGGVIKSTRRQPRDSFQEFESTLERLAGVSGATRQEPERRSHLQVASSR